MSVGFEKHGTCRRGLAVAVVVGGIGIGLGVGNCCRRCAQGECVSFGS